MNFVVCRGFSLEEVIISTQSVVCFGSVFNYNTSTQVKFCISNPFPTFIYIFSPHKRTVMLMRPLDLEPLSSVKHEYIE